MKFVALPTVRDFQNALANVEDPDAPLKFVLCLHNEQKEPQWFSVSVMARDFIPEDTKPGPKVVFKENGDATDAYIILTDSPEIFKEKVPHE